MRHYRRRRFLPLVVLVVVEAMLLLLAPGILAGLFSSGHAALAGSSGASAIGNALEHRPSAPSGVASGDGPGSVTGAVSGPGTGDAAPGQAGPGASGGKHCGGVLFYVPPCTQGWPGGDNGGATMTGVTSKTIDFVYYLPAPDRPPGVNVPASVAPPPAVACEQLAAWTNELNHRYELYGRKLVSLDGPGEYRGSINQALCSFPYFAGRCRAHPPQPACEQAEAGVVAAMHPAFVLAPVASPVFAAQLAADHVLVIADDQPSEQELDSYAPYAYSVSMNRTEQVRMLAQYYCAKLSGKPVQFAGRDVMHPGGSPVPPVRRLGILYPADDPDPSAAAGAELLASLVTGGDCGSPGEGTTMLTYSESPSGAPRQAAAAMTRAKAAGLTTLACICDWLAPLYLSDAMAAQGYYPEILLAGGPPGRGEVAQIYNQAAWSHAFGLSDAGQAQAPSNTDAVRAWHDTGHIGWPGPGAALSLSLFELMGNMIEATGPDLTPATIHAALLDEPPIGGDPAHPLMEMRAPYQWSTPQDARQVWWCPSLTSVRDGHAGSYVDVDGGARHGLGAWGPGTGGLFTPGTCR